MSRNLFTELRRRNVFRMGGLYLVAAWLIIQISGTVLPMLDAPAWLPRTILFLLALGFIPALIFSWVYELTPEGLRREGEVPAEHSIMPQTGQRMNHMIIAVLVLALGYFGFDKVVLTPRREAALMSTAHDEGAKEAATTAAAAANDKSVAVLPLANASGDKDQQYFSDGLSEGLIIALSRLDGLKVIGRNSSFQFRDSKEDSQAIAAKLGVATLLEGSVQRAGDVVRISASLIRAADRSTLWVEQYDRPYKDLFALQDEITKAVAVALRAKLLGGVAATEQTDRPPSGNLAAYETVLQGNFLMQHQDEADTRKAIALYEQATKAEPGYAYAWARLAVAYITVPTYLSLPAAELQQYWTRGREAGLTALKLNPDLAEAHAAHGRILQIVDHDVVGAEAALRHALELAPQSFLATRWLGVMLAQQGHLAEAVAMMRRAIALDPLSAPLRYNLGIYLTLLASYEEAETSIRRAIELQPQAAQFHANLALALTFRGHTAEAIEAARQEPDEFWRNYGLALACFAHGDRNGSDAALAWLIKNDSDDGAMQIAVVYAQRKQPDEVFHWLEHALATNDPGVTELYGTPYVIAFRDDPRFSALAKKIGLPPLPADAPKPSPPTPAAAPAKS
ncbi:MAG TPA: tetratricopeptide repeat protein [Rudaea sp.]|nr:tetratricopeptide repeat protein [Rudaea sp.]HSC13164.1 tetratricopeptide repeat protein [Rhodanobacteraceae bacterium]